MRNRYNVVGVDPGVSGGIALVDPSGAISLHAMPDSLPGLYQLLTDIRYKDAQLWIEEIPKFTGRNIPGSTVAVLFQNVGRIEGIALALGYSLHRVPPTTWQNPLGLGGKRSCASSAEWKRKLKTKAEELYPNVDGITLKTADALLIAHHAMGGER